MYFSSFFGQNGVISQVGAILGVFLGANQMVELDDRRTKVLRNLEKIISAKFVHILFGKNFLLCTMLPLIFRPYGEVFHVHVYVGLLVLNVYAF